MIIYNVPKTSGKTRDDYNRQIYADDTSQQAGWLTDAELDARFPPPDALPSLDEARAAKLAE